MPIRFRCPFCQQALSIARRKVGAAVSCTRCGAALSVPDTSDPALDAWRESQTAGEAAAAPLSEPSTPVTPAASAWWEADQPAPPTDPEAAAPPDAPAAPAPPPWWASQQTGAADSGPAAAPATADPPPEPVSAPAEVTQPPREPAPPERKPRRWGIALMALALLLLLGGAALLLLDRGKPEPQIATGHVTPAGPRTGSQLPPQVGQGGGEGTTPLLGNNELLKSKSPPKTEPPAPKLIPPPIPGPPKSPPPVKRPVRDPAAEEELYRTALKTARQALSGEDFDGAVTWFQIALQLRTTDEALDGLRQAERGRLEALARAEARKRQREHEQKLALYGKWMRSGQSARYLREFDTALQAFGEALKVFPDDARAAEAVAQTQLERERWALAQKRQQERARVEDERLREARAKRERAEYREAMETGWFALRTGKYDLALGSFGTALSLRPDDDDARDGWTQAHRLRTWKRLQEGLQAERERMRLRAEKARKEEQERAKAYQNTMAAGTEALGRRRYDEALGYFIQALQLWPDDPDASERWRAARAARDKHRAEQEARAKERAEERAHQAAAAAKRLEQLRAEQAALAKQQEAHAKAAALRQFLLDSQVALANGRYDDALMLLDRAGALRPDPALIDPLRQQVTARKRAWDEALKKRKEEAEARAKLVAEADRKKLEAAQKQREQEEARAERQRRTAAYERFLREGKQALDAGNYDTAADLYSAALRLRPNDPTVTGLLDKARQQGEAQRRALADAKAKRAQEIADAEKETKRRKAEADRLRAEQQQRAQAERKARDYERFLIDGKLALARGDAETALAQFGQARTVRDDPELAKLAEQARRRQQEQRALRAERERREAQERAAREAQLRVLRQEREREQQKRTAQERARRKAEDYRSAMQHGREALAQGKYLVAVGAFGEALALRPGDADATAGLRQAREGHERQQAEARLKAQEQEEQLRRKRAEEKAARLAHEFELLLKYGQAALAKSQFDSAVKSFTEALARKPGEPRAEAGLREARAGLAKANEEIAQAEERNRQRRAAEEARLKALAEARAKAAAPKPPPVPIDHRRKLLATARAAIELGRVEAAAAALAALKKLAPGDEALPRLVRDLDVARQILKADQETAKKLARQRSLEAFPLSAAEQQDLREAKVALHLEAARRHLEEGRPAEAARAFEAVLNLVPDHAEAAAGLAKARSLAGPGR